MFEETCSSLKERQKLEWQFLFGNPIVGAPILQKAGFRDI